MDVRELIWQYVMLGDVLIGTAEEDIVMVFHKSINLTKATSVTLYGIWWIRPEQPVRWTT